jgi:hypothetical protein
MTLPLPAGCRVRRGFFPSSADQRWLQCREHNGDIYLQIINHYLRLDAFTVRDLNCHAPLPRNMSRPFADAYTRILSPRSIIPADGP